MSSLRYIIAGLLAVGCIVNGWVREPGQIICFDSAGHFAIENQAQRDACHANQDVDHDADHDPDAVGISLQAENSRCTDVQTSASHQTSPSRSKATVDPTVVPVFLAIQNCSDSVTADSDRANTSLPLSVPTHLASLRTIVCLT